MTTPEPAPSRRRGGDSIYALSALIIGLSIGLIVVKSGSAIGLRAITWVEPLGTLWVNAIRMTVIPLIVASLVVAISDAGPGIARRLGTRALLVFFVLLVSCAVVAALLAPALFSRLSIDPGAARLIRLASTALPPPEVPTFTSWVVSLIPSNPIKAAADGAMLPLVVFTLLFGLALGRLEPAARRPVVDWFAGVASAATVLVRWVLALAPIGVFALTLSLVTKLGANVFSAVGFYIGAHSLLCVAMIAVLYVMMFVARRVPFAAFIKAALPAQVVAASTRSSMAALPVMVTSAEETLHLPRPVTSFALPLAVSTLRLNQPVSWLAMALFASKLYGVDLSTTAVMTLAVTSVLMSFSVPGIPSGSLLVIAPFLVGVGIPAEAIGVLIAVDIIPDIFKTSLNVTGHLTAVTLIGSPERQSSSA